MEEEEEKAKTKENDDCLAGKLEREEEEALFLSPSSSSTTGRWQISKKGGRKTGEEGIEGMSITNILLLRCCLPQSDLVFADEAAAAASVRQGRRRRRKPISLIAEKRDKRGGQKFERISYFPWQSI